MKLKQQYFFLPVLLFCGFLSQAQHNAYFFNPDWNIVKLNKNYVPAADDTCMIFASVRSYEESEKMFMNYDCNKEQKIHFFKIYFKGNNWTCVPEPNLSSCLRGLDSAAAVIYVEGLGKTFLTALDRATLFSRQYGKQIIMFDWPTYRPALNGGKNFKTSLKESEVVSKTFASFLDTLNKFKSATPKTFSSLCLHMHSMGNLLLMHAINNGYLKINNLLFNTIILNAACVPQKNHATWIEKLNIQKNIYITNNDRDKVLRGAKFATGFTGQLGKKARPPFAKNALYIDFSRVLEKQHNYWLFPSVLRTRPYIKDLYKMLLSGTEPDFSDENRYIKKPNKNRIEIFDLTEAQKGGIGISIGQ